MIYTTFTRYANFIGMSFLMPKSKPKAIQLDSVTQQNVDRWLEGPYDQQTKETILHLLETNPQEVIDSFYTTLSFGTGGLRGIVGVGCNRMNIYTIMTATQGLANYIKQKFNECSPSPSSVLIGYDSRNHSRLFAETAAKVLAGNGIHVYLFKELRPTPLISFGCRYKKCTAAIIITASHNPSCYNGYKVYWSDGGQILPPHDQSIMHEIHAVEKIDDIQQSSEKSPLIEEISDEIDEAYLKTVSQLQHYPNENRKFGNTLRIVYTSLHGAGITLMPQTLSAWGFTQVILVEEQSIPNGDFPTVKYPNPEDPCTLELGIEVLKSTESDLLLANDPDADRLAIAVRHQGEIHILNGNQVACLCLHHICEALSRRCALPGNYAVVKTIGTTELFEAIAKRYNIPCINVLTGFKYIGEVIFEWEKQQDGHQFLFGGEESCGYLLGTQARDKDGIVSGALICEVALTAKLSGKTLVDLLHDIYSKYGMYVEQLLSIEFQESKQGKESMKKGMESLRANFPKQLNGIPVTRIEDYQSSLSLHLQSEQSSPLKFPRSDMLLFWLEDGSKVMVRPSGTEPKVKVYCGVKNSPEHSIETAKEEGGRKAGLLCESIRKLLCLS